MSNSTQQSQPPQVAVDQIIGLYNQGQLKQTVLLAESLSEQYPNEPILYDILGAAYIGLKNTDKTIESYKKALLLNPNHTDAYNNMGMALYDQGKFYEAVTSYQKALKIEPDFADAHYNLGNAFKEAGNLKKAIESYQASLVINPKDTEVLLNYGNALKSYGDFDHAIKIYAKVLKVNPNFAAAQSNMDNAIEEKAWIKKTISDYARLTNLELISVGLFRFTENLLEQNGYLDTGISSYEQLHNISFEDAESYYKLGIFFQTQNKNEAAINSYEKAVKIYPQYLEVYNKMGMAFLEKGDRFSAIQSFKTALEIVPDNAEAHQNLGFSLVGITVNEPIEGLHEIVFKLLDKKNSVRPMEIVDAVISLIKFDKRFKWVLGKYYAGDIDNILERAISKLSKIPLLPKIMELCPLTDLEVEWLLKYLRSSILHNISKLSGSKGVLVFQSALAQQCYANEYIYTQTDEDSEIIEKLEDLVCQNLLVGRQPDPLVVASLASYKALHNYSWCHLLVLPNDLKQLKKTQISDFQIERQFYDKMPIFKEITDNVSSKVQNQYENNPYPRWQHTRVPLTTLTFPQIAFNASLKSKDITVYQCESPKILIAGCGTGLQSIFAATRYKNCEVLAVDLSLRSLAYAQRKTEELGIKNLKYMQADILNLDKLGRQFDIIECCGVLHHMNDPLTGWTILNDCLKAGGFMRISLYSERARQEVVKIRKEIKKAKISSNRSDMLLFRDHIINSEKEHHKRISISGDFYSMSNYRDLLFHVQEHRFTLPQINSFLSFLGLEFYGFEKNKILKEFRYSYPDPEDAYDLDKWDLYESENPYIFAGTESFWCRKIN